MAERYTTGVGHVTTRQDIQLHFAALEHVGTIMRRLAEVGVTTREACGNTVRNVTACHLAGVCQGEIFDVTPYAKAVSAHLLRNPLNQSLPRKFKIAFSGCQHDCALTPIHDLGFLAVKKADGTIGFRVTAGGGLGSTPRIAHLLYEYLPMEDLLPICEAILKVFDNLGNRKNRHKARMKFVIEKLGFEEFKRRVEVEFAVTRKSHEGRSLTLPTDLDIPPQLIQPVRSNGGNRASKGNGSDGRTETPFDMWKRTNVVPQRQPGFSAVFIRLAMGDITSAQMLEVADLIDEFANGNIRTTIQQNLCIRWVPTDRVKDLYERLVAVDLGDPGAELVEDIIACPGTDTCGLGITSSKGVARALAEIFPPGQVPEDLRDVSVKISGCHNSCAQHHIATIGLHGVGKRMGAHVAPHYELHLGGRITGQPKIGQMTVKLPAKTVPAAKAVLVPEGIDPNTDAETFVEFERRFGATGLIGADYTTPSAKIGDLGPKETTATFAAEKLRYAKGFLEACKTMSEELGKKLKADATKPDQATQTSAPVGPAAGTNPVTTLDLRGVMCPINYVKTKLKLEMMESGEILEVWLDAGEPIKNVPQSLRNDGQNVISEVPVESYYKVTVEKVV